MMNGFVPVTVCEGVICDKNMEVTVAFIFILSLHQIIIHDKNLEVPLACDMLVLQHCSQRVTTWPMSLVVLTMSLSLSSDDSENTSHSL